MSTSPLAALFAASNQPDEPLTFPHKDGQRYVLAEIAQKSATLKQFSRGQYVRYIDAAGPLRKESRDGLLLMFWRMLNKADEEDVYRITSTHFAYFKTLPFLDCMLMSYDGNAVQFQLSCSAMLEVEEAT